VSLKTDTHLSGTPIVVPGSVANLGGGFDTLGVAVDVYLRVAIVGVDVDGGSRVIVAKSTPPVRGANALERAFAAAVRHTGKPTPTVRVEVTSDIPMSAGLGSSAAATVAGLRVFDRVAGPLADSVILGLATALERHADNAAPAMFGGFTSVVVVDGADHHADNAAPAMFGGFTSVVVVDGADPYVCHWSWPSELRLVVATPAIGLATAKARAALPLEVPRADAIYNLQRVLALVHALETKDYTRLREAVGDRWHQPARKPLVPLLEEVLQLHDPDILGAFLSGAGPSVAVLAVQNVDRVAELLGSVYRAGGVDATVRVLSVHESSAGTGPRFAMTGIRSVEASRPFAETTVGRTA
jgi:homoserine kinase